MVLSHEVGTRKPGAAFYEACVRKADCTASECVFIDDLKPNVEGAQAYGLHGIVYRHPEDLVAKMRALGMLV